MDVHNYSDKQKQTPWSLVREGNYRLTDRHLSTKFSANILWIEGCRVVSAADHNSDLY
jgi:hypothetical protein